MSSNPVKPADFAASDVLSTQLLAQRQAEIGMGLDVACTKAAVDLQNINAQTQHAVIGMSLATLREATHADAAVLGMLDADGKGFEAVTVSAEGGLLPRLEHMKGMALAELPFLASRFSHLRLTEYQDTAAPQREEPEEARRLAELGIGSALVVAFQVEKRPAGLLAVLRENARGPWDVNAQLLLKLLGRVHGAQPAL